MDFFYFDADQRLGPVNAAQLKALALQGIITPDTVIEAGSKTLPARKIKGLEFGSPAPPPVEEVPFDDPAEAETLGSAPDPVPEPEPAPAAPADEKEEKARKRKERARADARGSLDGWVSFLTIIGWIEIIGGAIAGSFCLIAGLSDDKPELIGAGIGSAIGGFVSAILPLSIASIGRFMLTHHD
ncbi:MAG: DUF4339 domain-containing protein [Thermoguttaceae bacterium]|nr:DUF4339 domain-containing protein [Thermoguttaceae bacterium]